MANIGDNFIFVENNDGWVVGDMIGLSPSELETNQYEIKYIQEIQGNKIILNSTLQFFHYGSEYKIKTNQ